MRRPVEPSFLRKNTIIGIARKSWKSTPRYHVCRRHCRISDENKIKSCYLSGFLSCFVKYILTPSNHPNNFMCPQVNLQCTPVKTASSFVLKRWRCTNISDNIWHHHWLLESLNHLKLSEKELEWLPSLRSEGNDSNKLLRDQIDFCNLIHLNDKKIQ